MSTDNDLVCSNWWELIEDDGLDDILQLAETIRANPVYDDGTDDLLRSYVQPSAAAESVAIKSEPDEMLLDDNTLMALLNECLNTSNNNEFQSTESMKKELDWYVTERQAGIHQPSEHDWPFSNCNSFSYYSAPEAQVKCNLGCGSFRWSLYPSPLSQGLSSLSTCDFSSPDYMYPGFTGPAVSGPGLSTPSRKQHRRPSSSDDSVSSSDSVDVGERRRRPVKPRRRTKTNKMKVYHLWEFIRELLDASELHHGGCEVAPVTWESKENGVFRIVDSKRVAKLWGEHKRNTSMTYEKLSRSLRWCRTSGFLAELPKNANYPKKLCFRFGERAADMYSARRRHLLISSSL